jgi:hypothetical protein
MPNELVNRFNLAGDSLRHFFRFWRRIERKQPTTIVRYGDGEEALMRGNATARSAAAFVEDGWSAPAGMTRLGDDLLRTMVHTEPAYFYGIPGRNDVTPFEFHLEHILAPSAQLTFANLFCNLNYRPFLERLDQLREGVVVMASKRGAGREFGRLNVLEFVPMEHDCVQHWESAHAQEQARAAEIAQRYEQSLFLVSAGPMAKVLIDKMFTANPANRYLDVGSSIDEIVQGRKTRPYMRGDSHFSTHISRF